MKPEDVTIQFADSESTFEPISGQPTDSNLVEICEVISQILFLVPYNEVDGIRSLIGLIQKPAAYTSEYKAAPPRPKKPGIYDTKIPYNAKN